MSTMSAALSEIDRAFISLPAEFREQLVSNHKEDKEWLPSERKEHWLINKGIWVLKRQSKAI